MIIHAQLMRADQLDQAATLGVVPSFFAAHSFFWGDWHLRSFGEERGSNISPVRWAIDRARERGCRIVQLTTDKTRPDALRFYETLGFRATHEGMKLHLEVDER